MYVVHYVEIYIGDSVRHVHIAKVVIGMADKAIDSTFLLKYKKAN